MTRFLGLGVILSLVFAPCREVRGAEAGAKSLSAAITLTVGRNLDNTAPDTSLTLDPVLKYQIDSNSRAELFARFNRPTNPYEPFQAPRLGLAFMQSLEPWASWNPALRFSVSALELDRWANDGLMVRAVAAAQASKTVTEGLEVLVRIGPFGQFNEFRQRTSGADLPRFGFSERLAVSWSRGAWSLDLDFIVEQSFSSVWRNTYAAEQALSVQASDTIKAGVSHEFLGSLVDETTGFYSSLKLFDSRGSRVSAFVEVTL